MHDAWSTLVQRLAPDNFDHSSLKGTEEKIYYRKYKVLDYSDTYFLTYLLHTCLSPKSDNQFIDSNTSCVTF